MCKILSSLSGLFCFFQLFAQTSSHFSRKPIAQSKLVARSLLPTASEQILGGIDAGFRNTVIFTVALIWFTDKCQKSADILDPVTASEKNHINCDVLNTAKCHCRSLDVQCFTVLAVLGMLIK